MAHGLMNDVYHPPSLAKKRHMSHENEGANERDGNSCAMMMSAYLASAHARGKLYIYFRCWFDSSGLHPVHTSER
jgi:hypothetical protein